MTMKPNLNMLKLANVGILASLLSLEITVTEYPDEDILSRLSRFESTEIKILVVTANSKVVREYLKCGAYPCISIYNPTQSPRKYYMWKVIPYGDITKPRDEEYAGNVYACRSHVCQRIGYTVFVA